MATFGIVRTFLHRLSCIDFIAHLFHTVCVGFIVQKRGGITKVTKALFIICFFELLGLDIKRVQRFLIYTLSRYDLKRFNDSIKLPTCSPTKTFN